MTPRKSEKTLATSSTKRKRPVGPAGGKGPRFVPVCVLHTGSDGTHYKVRDIEQRHPPAMKAIAVRSGNWVECLRTPSAFFHIPLIDRLGRFTGFNVYRWDCNPSSVISTVISTICSRIRAYSHRHNKFKTVLRFLPQLLRASTVYALTRNSYFWDRVLFVARDLATRGHLLHKISLYYLAKLDENKRFVYSQASYQAYWLLFRAKRPRDKSRFIYKPSSVSTSFQDLKRDLVKRSSYIYEISRDISRV